MADWFTELDTVEEPRAAQLQAFVQQVEVFLKAVIEDPDFAFLWAGQTNLHREARSTFQSDVVASATSLRRAIPEIAPSTLDRHGLQGRPLRFKFHVISLIARRWDRFKERFRVRGWLQRIFDAIDVVLDSLVQASGGVGGVLKEFKDALAAFARSG